MMNFYLRKTFAQSRNSIRVYLDSMLFLFREQQSKRFKIHPDICAELDSSSGGGNPGEGLAKQAKIRGKELFSQVPVDIF